MTMASSEADPGVEAGARERTTRMTKSDEAEDEDVGDLRVDRWRRERKGTCMRTSAPPPSRSP